MRDGCDIALLCLFFFSFILWDEAGSRVADFPPVFSQRVATLFLFPLFHVPVRFDVPARLFCPPCFFDLSCCLCSFNSSSCSLAQHFCASFPPEAARAYRNNHKKGIAARGMVLNSFARSNTNILRRPTRAHAHTCIPVRSVVP